MEDDLTWLARTEHEWPKDAVYVSRHENAVEWHYVELSFIGYGHFTRDQWISRRAELQSKPSWDDAPEWAEWLAQHESGYWCWGSGPASISVQEGAPGAWWSEKNQWSGKAGEVLGDWRDTLERSQRDLSELAVTARLAEATENVLAAVPALMGEKFSIDHNDWFVQGKLPPVGTECEFCGGAGDADDPWHPDLMDGDRVTVIAHFECGICTLAAFTFKSRNPNIATVLVEQANYGCFRPIRTERDKAIDEMKQYCPYLCSWDTVGRVYAAALYDAGYRKQG